MAPNLHDTASIIATYKRGYFPMVLGDNPDMIEWIAPTNRMLLPIGTAFHTPRSLRKYMRKSSHITVSFNTDSPHIIKACAEETANRPDTWLQPKIIDAFIRMHNEGHVHTVGVYDNGRLVGGLYGLQIGGLFCGESMFSRQVNVSKIALCHLVKRLEIAGFSLLDSQYYNEHLLQFGAYFLPHDEYIDNINKYVDNVVNFMAGYTINEYVV